MATYAVTALRDHDIGRLPNRDTQRFLNVPRPELRIGWGWQTGMHDLVSCAHLVVQFAVNEGMMNSTNKPVEHFH